MTFPPDYAERVYAGVLGKIIGVYLGRPFEGWTHEQIMANLGEIKYYVNDRHDLPLRNHQLVVTDDDISGTFTFFTCSARLQQLPRSNPRSDRPDLAQLPSSKIEPSCGGVDWEIPQSTQHFCGSKMAFPHPIPARSP